MKCATIFSFLFGFLTVTWGQTYEEFRQHILKEEGSSSTPYRLHGKWHIGMGHRLHNKVPRYLTQAQIEDLFRIDLEKAYNVALAEIPNYYQHPKAVRLIIVALIYNLGESGFHNFFKFKVAIKNCNYKLAARELSNSLWAKQLPNRAYYYTLMLKFQL